MKKNMLFALAVTTLLACDKTEDNWAPDRDATPLTKADTVWTIPYYNTFPNYDLLHIPPTSGLYTVDIGLPYYYDNSLHQNVNATSGQFEIWAKAGNGGGPAGEGPINMRLASDTLSFRGGPIYLQFYDNTTGSDITNTLFVKFSSTTIAITLVQTGQQTAADSFTVNGVTSLTVSRNSFSVSLPITIDIQPSHLRWVPAGEASWGRFYRIGQQPGSTINQTSGGCGTYYINKVGSTTDPVTITLKDQFSYKYVYIHIQ